MIKNIKYTLKHKKVFLQLEKELTGKNSLSGYLHDLDKIFLYLLFSKRTVHKIHRRFSTHHVGNIFHYLNKEQAVIDWECARFTKPDKPLNAYQTMKKFYPELEEEILPVLTNLGLMNEGKPNE